MHGAFERYTFTSYCSVLRGGRKAMCPECCCVQEENKFDAEFLTVAADNDTAHCKPLPLRVLKVLLVGDTFQTALITMLKTNIWCSDAPQDM